jgi:PAS domain S-box-containing protein
LTDEEKSTASESSASETLDPPLAGVLTQNQTELIAVLDRDLRIRAFNPPSGAHAAGPLGRELHVGDDIRNLVSPGSLAAVEAICAHALSGESLQQDLEVAFPVGHAATYEMSATPLRGQDGAVYGVLIISRNVTQRRAHASEAQRAGELRRAILEAMPDAITVFNRAGDIVDFKGAHGVPIPMTPAELVGKNLRSMHHVPTERIRESLRLAFETGKPQALEYESVVDGVIRHRNARLHRISDDEALWVVRDVTEEKVNAQRLAFTDRMASLGTLAAGVAHELNNPLQYVLANIEVALRKLGTGADPSVRAMLTDAVDGLDRAAGIVNGLRAFSRAQEPEGATADVATAGHAAVKLASNRIAQRATLDVDLHATASVGVSLTQLTQVFLNLLLNAADALDASRADNHVSLRSTMDGDRITVSVSDNGSGIPAAIRERIFDPFFTTKPVGQGTGLGLSISAQIVRGAGGTLELQSVEGQGTTFHVNLAALQDSRTAGGSAEDKRRSTMIPATPPRVLLVDDDPMIRISIKRLLGDCHLTMAEDAYVALRTLEVETFDAVVCDVTMPGMSGVELLVEIAARWPERQASVVLMTGGILSDAQSAALQGLSPVILSKPFSRATVRQALVGALAASARGSAPRNSGPDAPRPSGE